EGLPLRAALPLSSRGLAEALRLCKPRRKTVTVTSRGVSSEPRLRRGSSSRMPATAAIDNETLDHLLSVVTGSLKVGLIRHLPTPGRSKDMPTPIRCGGA